MPLPALVPVTPENTDLHLYGGSNMLPSAQFKGTKYIKGEVAFWSKMTIITKGYKIAYYSASGPGHRDECICSECNVK